MAVNSKNNMNTQDALEYEVETHHVGGGVGKGEIKAPSSDHSPGAFF